MENLQVTTDAGEVKGVKEISVHGREYIAFRGIPYAQPPVGELRFEDPRPPLEWSGVRDASNFGDNCAQLETLVIRGIVGSDDCLYLNVYTTSMHLETPKAVMVWIHGGAFVLGSGDDLLYGPDHLMEKDIILVTINYRLGVLGFLNLEDKIAAGNQGLKDQVFALKWVKRNIAKFGGDPENVTIFGESAGGASIHYLTLSPLAQGLFHKAIIQSGVVINPWASVPGSPKRFARQIAASLGKESDDPAELLKFLKGVDVKDLILAQAKISSDKEKLTFVNPFGPGVDALSETPFLSVSPDEAVKSGIKVPCMVGYMNDEGLLVFGDTVGALDDAKYAKIDADFERLGVHQAAVRYFKENNLSMSDIRNIYFGKETISSDTWKNYSDLQSDALFICGIHDVLDIQAKTSKTPTYLYKLDCDTGMNPIKMFLKIEYPGTCHGDELPHLFWAKMGAQFGMGLPAPQSVPRLLIERFTELWTNFAKTGNPTPSKSPLLPITWNPLTKAQEYNCLMITDGVEMTKETNVFKRLLAHPKNKL